MKTAEQLGISQALYDGLLLVRDHLHNGTLPGRYDQNAWPSIFVSKANAVLGYKPCGCIGFWVEYLTHPDNIPLKGTWSDLQSEIHGMTYNPGSFSTLTNGQRQSFLWLFEYGPAKWAAARAIDNYLNGDSNPWAFWYESMIADSYCFGLV